MARGVRFYVKTGHTGLPAREFSNSENATGLDRARSGFIETSKARNVNPNVFANANRIVDCRLTCRREQLIPIYFLAATPP